MRAFVVAMVVAIGCGSDEEECKRSDRSGVYLIDYQTVSGDCGPLDSVVIDMGADGDEWGGSCHYDYSRWSDDSCELSTSFVCTGSEYSMSVVGKSDFEPGGDSGSGIMSVDLMDSFGRLVCSGTYRVEYSRQ